MDIQMGCVRRRQWKAPLRSSKVALEDSKVIQQGGARGLHRLERQYQQGL